MMNFDVNTMLNLIGNAATQSAGLWAFLEDAADSKQLHTAKANANGILAAYMTREGLKGATNALESLQGLAKGMSSDPNPNALIDKLGSRYASIETSFKYHASCRHTHPAGDALLALLAEESLSFEDIVSVTAYVHQAAIDVLGPVVDPKTVHQAKFSMGTVMGLLAVHGKAGLYEFEQYALVDPKVIDFRNKVKMNFDSEVDAAYPVEWQGKVEVETEDGHRYQYFLRYPKGDPENPLSKKELEEKFKQILIFSKDERLLNQSDEILQVLWNLESLSHISELVELL